MKRLFALVATLLLATATVVATPSSAAAAITDLRCDGTYVGGTYRHVLIPDGAECVIENATIHGNVRTMSAPEVVRIIDTDIRRNVMIRNVTRSVTIGAAGCRVDPVAGRNLIVRNSHNVAICEMSIANNLVVRNNTGRVMVRDNRVCNNIRVVRNDTVAIRVLRNKYAGQFAVADNSWLQRQVIKGNKKLNVNPAGCRRG